MSSTYFSNNKIVAHEFQAFISQFFTFLSYALRIMILSPYFEAFVPAFVDIESLE